MSTLFVVILAFEVLKRDDDSLDAALSLLPDDLKPLLREAHDLALKYCLVGVPDGVNLVLSMLRNRWAS